MTQATKILSSIIILLLITLTSLMIISNKNSTADKITIANLTTENETLSLQVDIALASHIECRDIVDKFIYVIEPQPLVINAEKLKQLNKE